MSDNDNILVEKFFGEARLPEIEDNGFSRRVMRSLPESAARRSPSASRQRLLSRIWAAFCTALAVVLSFVFHIWELLAVQLEVFVRTLPLGDGHSLRTLSLVFVAAILAVLYIFKNLDSGRTAI